MSCTPSVSPEEAMSRIAVEYIEMPDLKLTVDQARRFWNYPEQVCVAALTALEARGFLTRTRSGAFLRRASGAPSPLARAS